MSDDVKAIVLEYVRKEYLEVGDDRVIDATTPLISSGIVDSFSMVSLKVFLERTFAIRIPDREATPAAFDTVERIAALVRRLRGS